jgi:hypothetical protein
MRSNSKLGWKIMNLQGIREEAWQRREVIHDFTADFHKLVANYGS